MVLSNIRISQNFPNAYSVRNLLEDSTMVRFLSLVCRFYFKPFWKAEIIATSKDNILRVQAADNPTTPLPTTRMSKFF